MPQDIYEDALKAVRDVQSRRQIKPEAPPVLTDLQDFASRAKATVTSTTGGRHNPGSAHPDGRAIDLRTRDKSSTEIEKTISEATRLGFNVRDERQRPAGQKVWSGPHLHIEANANEDEYDRALRQVRMNPAQPPRQPDGPEIPAEYLPKPDRRPMKTESEYPVLRDPSELDTPMQSPYTGAQLREMGKRPLVATERTPEQFQHELQTQREQEQKRTEALQNEGRQMTGAGGAVKRLARSAGNTAASIGAGVAAMPYETMKRNDPANAKSMAGKYGEMVEGAQQTLADEATRLEGVPQEGADRYLQMGANVAGQVLPQIPLAAVTGGAAPLLMAGQAAAKDVGQGHPEEAAADALWAGVGARAGQMAEGVAGQVAQKFSSRVGQQLAGRAITGATGGAVGAVEAQARGYNADQTLSTVAASALGNALLYGGGKRRSAVAPKTPMPDSLPAPTMSTRPSMPAVPIEPATATPPAVKTAKPAKPLPRGLELDADDTKLWNLLTQDEPIEGDTFASQAPPVTASKANANDSPNPNLTPSEITRLKAQGYTDTDLAGIEVRQSGGGPNFARVRNFANPTRQTAQAASEGNRWMNDLRVVMNEAQKSGKLDAVKAKEVLNITKAGQDALLRNDGAEYIRQRDAAVKALSLPPRLRDKMLDLTNLPRALLSSIDLSYPFRQGVIGMLNVRNLAPSRARQRMVEFRDMLTSAVSQRGYDDIRAEIRGHQRAGQAEASGLYLATQEALKINRSLLSREESFASDLAGRVPILGRGIKASERSFTAAADLQRMHLYDTFARQLERNGTTFDADPQSYKDIASFVNKMTGRGTLHEKLESTAPVLNGLMFSPRFLASRLQVLYPLTYAQMAPAARKEALKEVAGFMTAFTTVAGLAAANGAEVGLDPESSDFGKIKYGNTRYDLLGGLQQPVVFLYRAGRALYAKQKGEKLPQSKQLGAVAERFARTKASPAAGYAYDWLVKNSRFKGYWNENEPFSHQESAPDLITPMFLRDLAEAYESEGLAGAFKTAPAMLGVGVQTYAPRVPTPPTKPRQTSLPTRRVTARPERGQR